MSIRDHVQSLSPDARIELFQLDMTKYSQGTFYLVTGDEGDTVHAVTFGGQVYTPLAINSKGWAQHAQGQSPRPTLAVSNVGGVFTNLVNQNNDLKGCTVTRIRTFARFLDDGAEPDSSAHLPLERFKINKKVKGDMPEIQWQLVSLLDQESSVLPARIVVRDYCDHTYRTWNGSSFDYTNVTCPYTGASSFDENGVSTTDANDVCSKALASGCEARFGNATLPFRGFPGVARFRGR